MQYSKSQSYSGSISTAEDEQQLFSDNTRSTFGDRLYFFDNDDELNDNLTLTLCSGKKKTLESDEFIETWEGNDEGLIWGEKEAKDKSWKEEWIEQRNIPKESNISQVSYSEDESQSNINFQVKGDLTENHEKKNLSEHQLLENENRASLGQLIGVDYKKNRRWKEKWFRRGRKLFVRKFVQQFCENNSRVINVWFEDSEFNYDRINNDSNKSGWKLIRNNKYGKKMSDQREWKESNYFHDDYCIIIFEERGVSSGSNNCPYFYSKKRKVFKDNSEIIYSKYYKGYGGENDTFEVDSDHSKDDNISDNISLEGFSSTNSTQNTMYSESWKEYTKIDCYGNKKGTKYGNRGKTDWREVWFEQIDGSNEFDTWYSNSKMQWGEKHGYSKSSNESFKVEWEEKNDQSGLRERTYIKNWEKVGESDSWGERLSETIDKTSTGKKVKLYKKNWYNNGNEIFKEDYNEEIQYNNQDENKLPTIILRNGEKRGEKLTTGDTWSEDWNENLKQCESSKKMIRTKLFTDKWWTKKSGEKWGEKKTIKLKQEPNNCEDFNTTPEDKINLIPENEDVYIENTEFWYSSEFEEYSDIWEINGLNQHGHKKGIDRRHNNKFIEWEEEWSKDNTEKLNKNCVWKLMDEEGLIEVWSEDKVQDSSGKFTLKKKGKKYNVDSRNEVVEEWEETCNDDGNGNTYTIKQGKGKENWYVDEFSRSDCTGEHWAIKRGCDEDGSWVEKWSERPDYKEAWKMGENRHGDKWEEEWKEDFKNRWKWARKSGENNIGDQWKEEWREEVDTTNHISKKNASKKGKKLISGEEWSEEWGESYYGIGNEFMGEGGRPAEHIEKWTNKYATDGYGNKWGNSWGDTWSWSTKVKSWGEKWENNNITEKW